MAGRFDEFFITVCKEAGGIEGLLDAFFDFMRRRTDFFYQMEPGDSMGFPPGVNTRMLLTAFKKQQDQHYKKFPKKDPAEYQQKLQKFRQAQAQKVKEENQNEAAHKQQKSQTHKIESVEVKSSQSVKEQLTQPPSKPQQTKAAEIVSSYNGGKTDKYTWSQQSRELVVTIPLPPGTKAKELEVRIQPQHLKVLSKRTQEVIIQGDFYEKVKAGANDSTWTVQNAGSNPSLVLNLEKADERIWSTILKGDTEIDTTKVNNTKALSDFDEETQAAIEKLRYDQEQKMKGLPTSDELKQRQLLQKAWNAQGSPFKGTPFDPSKINMQGFNPSE